MDMDLRFDSAQLEQMSIELQVVHAERNHCIAVIVHMALKTDSPCGYVWDTEGNRRVVVDMPYGQLSWIVSNDAWEQFSFFQHLPLYSGVVENEDSGNPIPPFH